MKNYAIVLATIFMLFFTSCESWLDIQQEGEVTVDQLYSTGEGYRTALNGVYQAMGRPALYGREFSFGLVDCMSQQYDLANESFSNDLYIKASEFKYNDVSLVDFIDNIWTSGFKVIANTNDLIQNIEKTSPELFEEGEMERNLIMGEAYACRALMHFDLLRLFAPALINDDQGTYVPYVDTYPEIYATSMQVAPFLDKVIADLVKAKTLVADFDTTAAGVLASQSGVARMSKARSLDNRFGYGDFFAGRGYRLSYYSITALLARVYQYAGKMTEALVCAEEVLDFGKSFGKLFYKDDFSGIANVGTNVEAFEQRSDLKLKSSLIFAAYNEKAYKESEIQRYFRLTTVDDNGTPVAPDYFKIKQVELFTSRGVEDWKTDIRSKNLIFMLQDVLPISGKWFVNSRKPEDSEHLKISPVLRLTEIQYIMAECYARKGNYGEAYRILNDVRGARNLSPLIVQSSWEEFLTDLICDARREWISEGQLFFLYKRLDAAFNLNGTMHKLSRGEASLPLPVDQK